MSPINKLLAAVVLTLPIAAIAQTTSPNVKPADQPRSQLEKEQTTENGQATKYPATDTMPSTATGTSKDSASHPKGMKHDKSGVNDIKPGDAPSYPAPAKDGTPTK